MQYSVVSTIVRKWVAFCPLSNQTYLLRTLFSTFLIYLIVFELLELVELKCLMYWARDRDIWTRYLTLFSVGDSPHPQLTIARSPVVFSNICCFGFVTHFNRLGNSPEAFSKLIIRRFQSVIDINRLKWKISRKWVILKWLRYSLQEREFTTNQWIRQKLISVARIQ